jgi:hypothetical protein
MKDFFLNTEKNEEIISLNIGLYDEFFVQELEYRLETDPLILGGFMDLFSSEGCFVCSGYTNCTSHCTGCSDCPNQCSGYITCQEY